MKTSENKDSSILETLKSIKARETTIGDVDKKVGHLIEALEAGDEEVVLKTLVRSETQHVHDAKKWKKTAFYGLGTTLILLACVFGLTVLSVFLAKDVYVSDSGEVENHPVMTNNDGTVLAVASATKKWSLSMAPELPEHLLKTLTEVTLTTPWNTTLSLEIMAREKTSVGVFLGTADETQIIVTSKGDAFLVETVKSTVAKKITAFSPETFPKEVAVLLAKRGRRITKVRSACGSLKCASFSVAEDEELFRKRRLQTSWSTCTGWAGDNYNYIWARKESGEAIPYSDRGTTTQTKQSADNTATMSGDCFSYASLAGSPNWYGEHTFDDDSYSYNYFLGSSRCAKKCTDEFDATPAVGDSFSVAGGLTFTCRFVGDTRDGAVSTAHFRNAYSSHPNNGGTVDDPDGADNMWYDNQPSGVGWTGTNECNKNSIAEYSTNPMHVCRTDMANHRYYCNSVAYNCQAWQYNFLTGLCCLKSTTVTGSVDETGNYYYYSGYRDV